MLFFELLFLIATMSIMGKCTEASRGKGCLMLGEWVSKVNACVEKHKQSASKTRRDASRTGGLLSRFKSNCSETSGFHSEIFELLAEMQLIKTPTRARRVQRSLGNTTSESRGEKLLIFQEFIMNT